MIKVVPVFGTRPEAIKMAPVVKALQARPDEFETVVCVTGQHQEILYQVLQLFSIEPTHDLAIMSANQSLSDITSRTLTGLDPVLESESPDWVLVQGDTTTAMAASLAAFYRKIPVGHVEAGLRTDDKSQPFPEEINRRITGVIADLHFAPTRRAANNLLREGVSKSSVVVTGNPVIDAIQDVAARPYHPRGVLPDHVLANERRVLLVTAHRRENFGAGLEQICDAVASIARRFDDVEIVFPVHPNPHVAGTVYHRLADVPRVTLLEPLDYQPLVWLMKRSYLIITDSGGIQEEAPGLGVPVLVTRSTTERLEGVEAGSVRLVGTTQEEILKHAVALLTDPAAHAAMRRIENPYGDGKAGLRIAEAIVNVARQLDHA